VPADKTSVVIKATTSNSKAKVAGTGTKELMPGTNKFTLTVTAENGTKRNVAVTIFREEGPASTPEPTPTPDENAELRLTSLEVVGAVLSPFFDEGIFEYTTSVVNLDLVQVNAIANIEDANIEIIGNEQLSEKEIIETLNKNGLKQGSLKFKIDSKKIIEKIRLENEKIAWIGIDLKGTNAKVTIAEATEKPEIIDENEYCDIVSTKEGIITKVNAINRNSISKRRRCSRSGTKINRRMDGRKIYRSKIHAC